MQKIKVNVPKRLSIVFVCTRVSNQSGNLFITLKIYLFHNCRDSKGKILKAAPFQDTLASGTQARIEPNRKWFGKFV